MSDLDDLVAAMVLGDPDETVPTDVVTAMAQAALTDGWHAPLDISPYTQEFTSEFGDKTIRIWDRTGQHAWETIVSMFYHCGWTPPEDTNG